MAVKQITLRAWSDNSDITPVEINQGDILSRTVVLTLLDSSGAPIDLTLSSVRVHFSKPDGTICYLSASVVNGPAGMAIVTLDSQCTAASGTVKFIVQITGAGGDNLFIIGPEFTVGAINIEGSIISANEFTALTDALAQVQSIANKVDKSQTINGHALTGNFSISAADTEAIPITDKGQPNGVPQLDKDGNVIQKPASYGQAGGGVTWPSTIPTLGSMLKAGAGGTAVAATEGADYYIPHDTTVDLGGYGVLHLSKIGHSVSCVWICDSTSIYFSNSYTPISTKIPTGYIPSVELACDKYTTLGTCIVGFKFQTDGTIQVASAIANTYPYFNPGSFTWLTD